MWMVGGIKAAFQLQSSSSFSIFPSQHSHPSPVEGLTAVSDNAPRSFSASPCPQSRFAHGSAPRPHAQVGAVGWVKAHLEGGGRRWSSAGVYERRWPAESITLWRAGQVLALHRGAARSRRGSPGPGPLWVGRGLLEGGELWVLLRKGLCCQKAFGNCRRWWNKTFAWR